MNIKQLLFGVYHVANPTVKGRILGIVDSHMVAVQFDEPVEFSKAPSVGKRTTWLCSQELLYTSSKEARAAHISGHE